MKAKDMNTYANDKYLKLVNKLTRKYFKYTLRQIRKSAKRGSFGLYVSYFTNTYFDDPYYSDSIKTMVVELIMERLTALGYTVKGDFDGLYPELAIKWENWE